MKQNVMPFAREPETRRLFEQDALDQLFDDFAEGMDPGKGEKEETMAGEGGLEAVADALERLSRKLDDALEPRKRRRAREEEDEPESAREMRGRARRGEASQVAFEVKVPVGREGGTLKGLLIFDVPVRDDRELEDLANEVERNFRRANVFTKQDFRGGYGNGYHDRGGYGGYRDRGYGYDRDRDWRR